VNGGAGSEDGLQRLDDGLADAPVSGYIHLFEVPGLPAEASITGEAHPRDGMQSGGWE
jgi:hypothetical protein